MIIRIERFHQSYPSMPDLYHTYCDEHSDWGTCTELADAHLEVAKHLKKSHKEA